MPKYATALSAGMDLHANIDEPVTLRPLEHRLIPSGLFIALPPGYEAQVRPRSGLALKHGITVLNAPGTIDADYRGEVGVLLVNLSDKDFVVASCVSQYLYDQLQKAGVESYIVREPEGGHGMGMYSEANLQKMVDFLKKVRTSKKK